jgi:hypothetical protein
MAFQEALNNIIDMYPSFTTEEEIVTNNFKVDCAEYNILVHRVQYGGYTLEHVQDQEPQYYEQTIQRAYATIYVPRNMSHQLIDAINLEGNLVAGKINYLHDEMFQSINPSLIGQVPISYVRRHTDVVTITNKPFEVKENYNLLVNKSYYEEELSEYDITNYDDLDMLLIIDPKSGRKANAYPVGLFVDIGKAIRQVAPTSTHSG